jgi:hypothetical protein
MLRKVRGNLPNVAKFVVMRALVTVCDIVGKPAGLRARYKTQNYDCLRRMPNVRT